MQSRVLSFRISKLREWHQKSWKLTKTLIPNSKSNLNECKFVDVSKKVEELNQYFVNVGREAFNKTQMSASKCDNFLNNEFIFKS